MRRCRLVGAERRSAQWYGAILACIHVSICCSVDVGNDWGLGPVQSAHLVHSSVRQHLIRWALSLTSDARHRPGLSKGLMLLSKIQLIIIAMITVRIRIVIRLAVISYVVIV